MLNPLRETMSRAAREARGLPSPFLAEAEAALSGFREVRAELERQVRRGDLTPKVARERASSSAAELQARLLGQAEGYSASPRVFQDRLIEATNARERARDALSIEGLQRETNRLLRLNLMEQQLQSRAAEFEGKSFERPMSGGPPGPTLGGLLGFHQLAVDAGDDVAIEWARRQLEGLRNRVANPEDARKIDLATDRPDRVNPRLIDAYCETLKGRDPEDLETFVCRAKQEKDANACIASFVMARQAPDGPRLRWVRMVLDGLAEFPDSALTTLRRLEAEARDEEAQAARSQARLAASRAEFEARLDGLEAPSVRELERESRIQSKPVARPGEAIGLALDRRGAFDATETEEATSGMSIVDVK